MTLIHFSFNYLEFKLTYAKVMAFLITQWFKIPSSTTATHQRYKVPCFLCLEKYCFTSVL